MASARGCLQSGSFGQFLSPKATMSSATSRRSRMLGLAAVLALAVGVWAEPPVARAFDDPYYQWCLQAVGEDGYCCNQAGGVWLGGSCSNATPSPAPTYVPPNTGILFP